MMLIRTVGGIVFALALVILILLIRERAAGGRRGPGWAARFATASGLLLVGVAYAFLAPPVRDWVALVGVLEVVAGMALERALARRAEREEP